jgi:hypothetical protein
MSPYLKQINAAASRDVARILQIADGRAALRPVVARPRYGWLVVCSFPAGLVIGFAAAWYFIR